MLTVNIRRSSLKRLNALIGRSQAKRAPLSRIQKRTLGHNVSGRVVTLGRLPLRAIPPGVFPPARGGCMVRYSKSLRVRTGIRAGASPLMDPGG